jgi:hypothetical protein
MKNLLILITIMLVGGCATPLTPEQKQKALRDSAVGTYEGKNFRDTLVFLDNGVIEAYRDGEKRNKEGKWKVVDGEIHADENRNDMAVLSINKDGSLTIIAKIRDGERAVLAKELQSTYKRIK